MRRRKPAPSADRPEPPRWTQSFIAGMQYAAEVTGSRDSSVLLRRLRLERFRWCQANGCHRAGTKTCAEVFSGNTCRAPGGQ